MVHIPGNPPVFIQPPTERKNPAQTDPKSEFLKKTVEQNLSTQSAQAWPQHSPALGIPVARSSNDTPDSQWELVYGQDGSLQEKTTTPQGVEYRHPYPAPTPQSQWTDSINNPVEMLNGSTAKGSFVEGTTPLNRLDIKI